MYTTSNMDPESDSDNFDLQIFFQSEHILKAERPIGNAGNLRELPPSFKEKAGVFDQKAQFRVSEGTRPFLDCGVSLLITSFLDSLHDLSP